MLSGSYDSHTFSGSGKNTEGCGTASFVVNQPVVAPQPTQTPGPPTPVGPAQGVPTCGNGLFFQRSDAADSAKTFCNQLAKDGSWAKGPQSLKFSNVKIYNNDGTVHSNQQFALSVSPNAAWCPKDLALDTLAMSMTVDRCVADIMTGVDGCKCLHFFCAHKDYVVSCFSYDRKANIVDRWPICCAKKWTIFEDRRAEL
jgi:hypothetical protein